jgi:hypothetical protein
MSNQFALDVVVAALRNAVGPATAMLPPIPATLVRDVHALARQNKILSLLHDQLAGTPGNDGRLADTATIMAVNSALLRELSALVPALQTAGLKFLVIKGPVQQRLIHGTFFQRAAADLDLLVRAEDFPRARHLLAEHGYDLSTPSVWWRSVLGEEHFRKRAVPHLAVDLHHRVHQPGAPAPYDAARLFSDTEIVVFSGIAIPTLNALDAMLLCTISIAKALYNREPCAAYLCDLYVWLMAAAPDAVGSFQQTARSVGLGGHAAIALGLTDALFDSHFSAAAGAQPLFRNIARTDLLRMILLPRDPSTPWPRRRDVLWELCERRPARYGREVARVLGSELTRRLVERGAAA